MSRVEQLGLPHLGRDSGEPSAHVLRIVQMLVVLMRRGSIDFDFYRREFERSERQYSRDLQQLRAIGEDVGLRITKQKAGCATLIEVAGRNRLRDSEVKADSVLRAVARALGAPIERELRAPDGPADGFLVFAMPRLVAGSEIAATFDALKGAHAANASVRFHYRTARLEGTRRVEPYRVLVRSGRYYLVGYDLARRAWRHFALDQICGPVTRAGTFRPRPLPERYLAGDAIGTFNGTGPRADVAVRLSPVVAASAAAREWQSGQHVTAHPDGSAEIVFTDADIDEIVRWTLGFGGEAAVVAPPEAVAMAARSIERLRRAHGHTGAEPAKDATGVA